MIPAVASLTTLQLLNHWSLEMAPLFKNDLSFITCKRQQCKFTFSSHLLINLVSSVVHMESYFTVSPQLWNLDQASIRTKTFNLVFSCPLPYHCAWSWSSILVCCPGVRMFVYDWLFGIRYGFLWQKSEWYVLIYNRQGHNKALTRG